MITFINQVLAEEAELQDIDNWVDEWHDYPEVQVSVSLRKWLGFTEPEYEVWIHNPDALAQIVQARRIAND